MNKKVYLVEETYSNGEPYEDHREYSYIRGVFKTFGAAQNKVNQIRKGMIYDIMHSPDGKDTKVIDKFGETIDGDSVFYTRNSLDTLAFLSRFGFRDFYCWRINEMDLN